MQVVAVRHDPRINYPLLDDHSPGEDFPESPFRGSVSPGNLVYSLVRQCLKDAGADIEHYGTPSWNPLGDWIKPGSRVFILPNLVVNRRSGEAQKDFFGKCTHGSMVRAALDYSMIATGSAEHVSF